MGRRRRASFITSLPEYSKIRFYEVRYMERIWDSQDCWMHSYTAGGDLDLKLPWQMKRLR